MDVCFTLRTFCKLNLDSSQTMKGVCISFLNRTGDDEERRRDQKDEDDLQPDDHLEQSKEWMKGIRILSSPFSSFHVTQDLHNH